MEGEGAGGLPAWSTSRSFYKATQPTYPSTHQMKLEAAGIASHGQQIVSHTTGCKSFARTITEYNEKHGTDVGRIEGMKITHLRKDGTYIEYPPEMHIWLKKTLSLRWRYYKCELKEKYFYCFEFLEYNLAKCPMDMQHYQWEY